MINRLLFAGLLLLLPSFGYAACALPASTASFGSVTTFVANSTVSAVTTNANVNCGAGAALSLLGNNQITFQLTGATNSNGTRGILKRSGDTGSDNVPVRLCTDSACATELTVGGTPFVYGSQTLINLAGLLGSLNFTIPIYLRTVPGQVVAAGTYQVTLNMAVTYRICTSIAIGNLCLSEQTGSGVIPITVTAILTNDCTTITAPNISFGSAPLVGSFSSVSQTINVLCSKGSTYTVGLSNGSYPVGSVRNMASGANRLSYEIYKSTTSNRWGPGGTERWSSTTSSAVSADGLTRGFNYTARVLTSQNTPPAGNYSDSVVVDLSF
ncbi:MULTISPECIES: Csu type fimbrial protein [Pantoea]|jgi:spore coat protein U-like protein|uniref:Spore coat U domain-containing protein n=1 Tax=Pantoea brenneri TaxID=472694 RepID=A0A7Y6NGH4_9GAMM|nr:MULTISPECIES: spore coat U domain-containing protein [Pantoea]KKD31698.1 fimbrial protein [Pantoea sp. 3.5.1]MBZ6395695.1 spore coat U domain-containing protein [Pantoea sp.]MBZ6439319.1 spore coat U domain-containing protein [Pantoea sp.]MDU4128952.1 spore coat U domain-containing protein [Pantoea sp.]NUY43165.1 spore coat U domain-containing protein [Pantoea brenneri]